MEGAAIFRMVSALVLVLGLLAGALWLVRRFGLRLPGAPGGGGRLAIVERTALDNRRSVALIRRDGREHLLLLAPEGAVVIEHGIVQDGRDEAAAAERAAAAAERERIARESLEAARERLTLAAQSGVAAGRAVFAHWRNRDFARLVQLPETTPAPKRKPRGRRRATRR